MCQYNSRCKVGTHRPGTKCPRKVEDSFVILIPVILLVLAAAEGFFS